MALIYQTKNFIAESHEKSFVPRNEGGHIRIKIKDQSILDRTEVGPEVAIELMRFTMLIGKALEVGMNNRGVKVVKVNYQDMGNWAYKVPGKESFLHVHIMGRVWKAKNQPFPESVYLPDRKTGFYKGFRPLNSEDIKEIKKQINILLKQDKYQPKKWGLIE